MTIQEIGTAFIVIAMGIAFFQKARDGKQQRVTPFLTKVAASILIIVGLVDVYLWFCLLYTSDAADE